MRDLLFTPGPLTTSRTVRAAMRKDWGSRDEKFILLTRRVRERIGLIANAAGTHVTALISGSGTYGIEAVIATLMSDNDHLLVAINGEYGKRIETIASQMGKKVSILRFDELEPVDPACIARHLLHHPEVSFVALVHLETTSGVLNPLGEVASIVARAGRHLIVDAMSSFGAYSIDVKTLPAAAVVASSNKCLHGAPGVAFVILDRILLARCRDNSRSLCFDLYDQVAGFEKNGQWRFTPPTHCLAALDQALIEHQNAGGCAARLRKYVGNAALIIASLEQLGFRPLLGPEHRSAVILTFGVPTGGWFDFSELYEALASRGFLIYPGKLTETLSFRIGCIGELTPRDVNAMLDEFSRCVTNMVEKHRLRENSHLPADVE